MPYEWKSDSLRGERQITLSLWPYRSLLKRHFVAFIGVTAALISTPLFMVLGTSILWGLLPFIVLTIAGIWGALQVSYRRSDILEHLVITPEITHLTHERADKPKQEWQANPYWVRVHLQPSGGPVENYITLHGGPRDVEIGRFLDSAERLVLYSELTDAFRNLPAEGTP